MIIFFLNDTYFFIPVLFVLIQFPNNHQIYLNAIMIIYRSGLGFCKRFNWQISSILNYSSCIYYIIKALSVDLPNLEFVETYLFRYILCNILTALKRPSKPINFFYYIHPDSTGI